MKKGFTPFRDTGNRKSMMESLTGFTLVETLVAVTITATIGAVIASTFLAGQSYYSNEKDRTRNEAEAMEAITLMEKVIRVASSFVIYDNKSDMNEVTHPYGGSYIRLRDAKGNDNSSDDEIIDFWRDGEYCYYESHYPAYPSGVPYGTKTKELARHFNSLTFSGSVNGLMATIEFQIDVPYGVIDYSTSAMLRN